MKTETLHTGEFILSEANGQRSRENITVAEGQNLGAGAVVGKITADGKYAVYDNAVNPADGTEAAAGILYADVDATDGDMPGVIIARDAEVKRSMLVWKSGADDTAKNAGIADMAALGIIAR